MKTTLWFGKPCFKVAASALFFLLFVTASNAGICDGCIAENLYVDLSTVLNDSLNGAYKNDSSYLSALRASADSSKICFIGTIVSVNSPTMPETVTISCAKKIKGSVPAKFKVFNDPNGPYCYSTAKNIVGRSFLCTLNSTVFPPTMGNIGVYEGYCSVPAGNWVTKTRIVSFSASCVYSEYTGTANCKVTTRFAGLDDFLGITAVSRSPQYPTKISQWHAAVANKVFTVSGRSVGAKARAAGRYFSITAIDKNKIIASNTVVK